MAQERGATGVYAGKTAEQRRSERLERLVAAGRDIWRSEGWAAVSMRAVCARAQLTDRYFYEHFDNRDDLLVTIRDRSRDEMLRVLLAALPAVADEAPLVQLRFGIATVVRHLAEDPRDAQLLFGEHAGSEALERRRRESLRATTDLLMGLADPHLRSGVDREGFRVTVLMGIGGFHELISAWQAGVVTGSVDDLVEHAASFADLLASRFVEDPLAPPHG